MKNLTKKVLDLQIIQYNCKTKKVDIHTYNPDSKINKFLHKLTDDYDRTMSGSDPSIFFGISTVSLLFWICAFIICYLHTAPSAFLLMLIVLYGCVCLFINKFRIHLLHVSIISILFTLLMCGCVIPYAAKKHYPKCENAQKAVADGKFKEFKHKHCIYMGYYIRNINKFK